EERFLDNKENKSDFPNDVLYHAGIYHYVVNCIITDLDIIIDPLLFNMLLTDRVEYILISKQANYCKRDVVSVVETGYDTKDVANIKRKINDTNPCIVGDTREWLEFIGDVGKIIKPLREVYSLEFYNRVVSNVVTIVSEIILTMTAPE